MGMLIKINRKFKHFRSNMQVSAQNIAHIYIERPPTGTSLRPRSPILVNAGDMRYSGNHRQMPSSIAKAYVRDRPNR